jgi:hypothetical protein
MDGRTDGPAACGQCAVIRITPDPASARRVTYWRLRWEERWAWLLSTDLAFSSPLSFQYYFFLEGLHGSVLVEASYYKPKDRGFET